MIKPTLAKIKAMILKGNPDAKNLEILWVKKPKLITYPTGVRGYLAEVSVSAIGFKVTLMTVDSCTMGIEVRGRG